MKLIKITYASAVASSVIVSRTSTAAIVEHIVVVAYRPTVVSIAAVSSALTIKHRLVTGSITAIDFGKCHHGAKSLREIVIGKTCPFVNNKLGVKRGFSFSSPFYVCGYQNRACCDTL